MSRRHQHDATQTLRTPAAAPPVDVEHELYVEPAQMDRPDVLGVVVALVALAIIGVSGYIWLNPDLSAQTLFAHKTAMPNAAAPTVASAGAPAEAHVKCPYCGMFADNSRSTIAVMWADGGSATFDSFDCLFSYMKEQHAKLESGTVKDYNDASGQSHLDLNKAYYLYDTKEAVENSMPPFTAAFTSRDAATAAQKTMGGEALDFAGLEGKWK